MRTTTPELAHPPSTVGVGDVPTWAEASLARELFAELGGRGARIAVLD